MFIRLGMGSQARIDPPRHVVVPSGSRLHHVVWQIVALVGPETSDLAPVRDHRPRRVEHDRDDRLSRREPLEEAAIGREGSRIAGTVELTQSEFLAIKARRDKYQIRGEVDRSAPGKPVIRVRLAASAARGTMPSN